MNTTKKTTRVRRSLVGLCLCLLGVSAVQSCSSSYPNRNPVGELFPSVEGQSLEQEPIGLPEAFAGEPALLLLGYEQKTQFDIDRWLMGVLQAGLQVRIVEVPTIPSLVPSLLSGWIDGGMRSGIPSEDWGSVVTLYGGAAKPVAEWTGTENGRLTRVVLLDSEGRALWFYDRGYSVSRVLEIEALLAGLQ